MSLPLVTIPDLYDFIVEFCNISDTSKRWRNTWTFHSDTVPVFGAGIIAAFGGFSVATIHSDARIFSYKCYNWSRGTHPYPSGSPIFDVPDTTPGNAGSNWTHLSGTYVPVGGEVCMELTMVPQSPGKVGRKFLRALLGANDISSISGGRWSLVPTLTNLNLDLGAIASASGLADYIIGGTGGQALAIARYSAKTHTAMGSSQIASIDVTGVTTNRQTRKNPH